jgi:bacteriocin biosynthesis cyclodehydratase domain-containing protein
VTALTEKSNTVLGLGPLADAVRALIDMADTTVAADPRYGLAELVAAQTDTLAAGKAFLPVRIKGVTVEIGPLVRAGQPGCVACAQERHRAVLSTPPMHPRLADEPARIDLPPHWRDLVAELALHRLTSGLPDNAVLVVRPADHEVSQHHVTAVPGCPVCDDRSADSAEAGEFEWSPRPQPEPERLRINPVPPLPRLHDSLVDHRFGPVVHVYRDGIAPMAFAGTELVALHRRQRMDGYGRCPDYESASSVGLLEAVERDSGSWPLARLTTESGSYRDLADRALDPALLGLPDPAYDGHPASLLDPYSPDTPTAWVWAHATDTGRPVLIPEHVAYYGVPSAPGRARYLYECSNGCAVGACLEEAVLYACLEVIERDAFLLSWYSQTPGTRITTAGITDPVSAGMLQCLTGEGYSVHLYDISADTGIPVIWALALDPANKNGATLSAAAAHPNPAKAISGALVEVAAMAVLGNRRQDHPSVADRAAMLADPTLVRSLSDHVALHTLPDALPRLSWLLDGAGPPVDAAEHFGDWRTRWVRPDLTDTARLVVDAMRAAGMPPVVVRQTTARDTALGVEVVKVVAPGGLAMTFGHVHNRTRGLPRLDRARARSGFVDPVLPHPFP